MVQNTGGIDALLQEERSFPPPADFAAKANMADPDIYAKAAADPEAFWAGLAEGLDWFQKWDTVLDWSGAPFAKWFIGGKLNVSYNCIDRHVKNGRRNKAAIVWEGEPGDWKVYTYGDLLREVCQFANGLKSLGIRKGDRVTIYLPMTPELPIAMLACARIGAPHSVVFGGFSAESLRDRINDSESKLLITADGGWRRGGVIPLKQNADDSLDGAPSVEKVVVLRRTGTADDKMVDGRDIWWHDLMEGQPMTCEPEPMDSEDMLFLLYTSGTTGKPKGIVHTSAGYLLGTMATTKWVFDIKEDDIYWCTADIGWVTGHSYIVYGPLANGATTVMYEGSPDYPDRDRFWAIVAKYAVTILYTAPTAIRTFMRWGEGYPQKHDMSSLRLMGTVGEPINPEAWVWYWQHIGGGRCPVVDTWWQTETGAMMIAPLPGLTTLKPGSATRPFPGIQAEILDADGNPVGPGGGGYLVVRRPWPSMLRGVYGDPGTVHRYLLVALYRFTGRGHLLHSGRRAAGRGRLLLAAGPRGRRNQRVGPPHRHHGGGERAGRQPEGRRGCLHRQGPRGQGSGRGRLRHPQGRCGYIRRRGSRVEGPRGRKDRHHGPPRRHPLRRRAAQDPQRQNNAPPAARRGRGPRPGRHHHPGRPGGGGLAEGAVRG